MYVHIQSYTHNCQDVWIYHVTAIRLVKIVYYAVPKDNCTSAVSFDML